MESILNFNKLTTEPISVLAKNKVFYIKYNYQTLFLKTPLMISPFGINKNQNNYYLDLSLDKETTNIAFFYQWLQEFESKVKYLLKEVDPELIDNNFVSCIKYNGDSFKNLRTKVDSKNGDTKINIHSKYQDKDLSKKLKQGKMYCLLKCQSVWKMNGKWGYSWRVEDIFVKEINLFSGYAFREISKTHSTEDETIEQDLNDSIDIFFNEGTPICESKNYSAPDIRKTIKKQYLKIKKKKDE